MAASDTTMSDTPPPEDPDQTTTPGWRTGRTTPSPTPTPPPTPAPPTGHTSAPGGAYGPPPGQAPPPPQGPPPGQPPASPPGPAPYGAPATYPPPAQKKSKAPLLIGLGVLGLVVVVVLVVVGVTVLGGDDDEAGPTTTTEDSALAEARSDLRGALTSDDRDQVESIVDDFPELLEGTDAPQGETTPAMLDDDGLGTVVVATQPDDLLRVLPDADDVSGLVLSPAGLVLGEVGAIVTTQESGDNAVLLVAEDAGPAEVDVSVGEVTVEETFILVFTDGEIANPGDAVVYEIDLPADSLYTLVVDEGDVEATIEDPEGTELETTPGTEGPRVTTTEEGTYRVTVIAPGTTTTEFAVSLLSVPDFTITNLSDGEPADSGFGYTFSTPEEADGQFGRFRVEVREGVTVKVTATPDGSADLGLTLRADVAEDDPRNDAPAGEPESIEYTADQYSRLEFQAEILNSVADGITIDVERVS